MLPIFCIVLVPEYGTIIYIPDIHDNKNTQQFSKNQPQIEFFSLCYVRWHLVPIASCYFL